MRTISALLLALGCAPPPELVLPKDAKDTAIEDPGPRISILYPEPGEVLTLEPGCGLTSPLIVVVEGLELVPFGEDVAGEGHWHGGTDLDDGYCMSWVAYCDGRNEGAELGKEEAYTRYDGRALHQGLQTLYVSLNSNTHEPLGIEDQVEVELAPPRGEDCP